MNASLHQSNQRPTLAILTVADRNQIFRGNQGNYVDLIRTGIELGADVYVITASEFKLSGTKTPGYVYDFQKKAWSRQMMPMPHVIYNRIPYRNMEMLPEVQQTIQSCIKNKQVTLFNPAFFNKWSLFEWLNKAGDIKKWIPSTKQLTSAQELEAMLKTHSLVYLKPVRGKAGKGIMRIDRKAINPRLTEYKLKIQEMKQTYPSTHFSIESLWNQIQEYRGNQEYIMQQGISLSSYKNRPYDLRALIQKTSKGQWSVTGIGARIAGKSSITTHVPRGGSIDDPEKLLVSGFGTQAAKSIMNLTKQAALKIARRIEKSSGQLLGEMSMDLGIDTSGRIWFFEANSKPMKFDEPEICKKSLERIILYSLYLTKKGKRRR